MVLLVAANGFISAKIFTNEQIQETPLRRIPAVGAADVGRDLRMFLLQIGCWAITHIFDGA